MSSLDLQVQTVNCEAPHAVSFAATYSDKETMEKIRAKVSKKRDKSPQDKAALLEAYAKLEISWESHSKIALRYIPKGEGKPDREISIISLKDLKTATSLSKGMAATASVFETEDDFGASRGKGRRQAVNRLWTILKESKQAPIVMQADIQDFFPSVNHNKFQEKFFGPYQWTFSKDMMRRYALAKGSPGKGLPQGSPLSPPLAQHFLTQALNRIRAEIEGTSRLITYVDDLMLIDPSDSGAMGSFEELCEGLAREGLLVHPGKMSYCRWEEGAELNYLGYRFTWANRRPMISLTESKFRKFTSLTPLHGSNTAKAVSFMDGWSSEMMPVNNPKQLAIFANLRWKVHQAAKGGAKTPPQGHRPEYSGA